MKRMIVVTVIFASLGATTFFLAERWGWFSEAQVYGWMADAGWKGAVIGVALLIGDVMLPVPSSVVMTLHGVAFGPWWGTVYSTAGSMGCAWIGYELGRRLGTGGIDRVGASPDDVSFAEKFFDRFGPYAVILSRPVPLFAEVVTCLAGMQKMPAMKFGTAAFCGTLPLSAVYAVWGARNGDAHTLLPTLVIAVALPVIGWAILAFMTRSRHAPGSAIKK